MSDTCASCRYARQGPETLMCHRNPPTTAFIYVPGPGGAPVAHVDSSRVQAVEE